ncbi:hypothetical protein ACX3VG_24850, partial [Escherichia coli]
SSLVGSEMCIRDRDLRWQINTERQGMVARGVDDADQLRAFVVSEDRMKEAFGLLKTLPV